MSAELKQAPFASASTSKAPPIPMSLAATNLNPVLARDIFLKTVFRLNLTSPIDMAKALCVSAPVIAELIEITRAQNLLETMGNRGAEGSTELHFQMSDSGRARAMDALAQSEYFGPLPVILDDFKAQSMRQSIKDVYITESRLLDSMKHLLLPDGLLGALGPAVNSGKSILMYGPPGNGKSSITNSIRDALGDKIYVPKFLEYSGQVISVYDPIIHEAPEAQDDNSLQLRRSDTAFDSRYILCKRPSVITGGELSLSMLELNYNPVSKTYQAPLQLKATGGVFVVDDLGRQQEPPQALINRWIVPMEGGFDILSLQSGEKFIVPFDTLVIFSTNYHPKELFDGAALRRIAYKVLIDGPSQDQMIQFFLMVAKAKNLPVDQDALVYLFKEKYATVGNQYAAFHAIFLIEQIMSTCEYREIPLQMTPELIDFAWANLFVKDSEFSS